MSVLIAMALIKLNMELIAYNVVTLAKAVRKMLMIVLNVHKIIILMEIQKNVFLLVMKKMVEKSLKILVYTAIQLV